LPDKGYGQWWLFDFPRDAWVGRGHVAILAALVIRWIYNHLEVLVVEEVAHHVVVGGVGGGHERLLS
jgi:hypothetical protein